MERYKDEFGAVLGVGSSKPANGSIATIAEVAADDTRIAEANKPKEVTMRQARLALLQQGLLVTVDNAIMTSADEALKIEWQYATSVNRNWQSLISLATSLNMTSADLDALFLLASTK